MAPDAPNSYGSGRQIEKLIKDFSGSPDFDQIRDVLATGADIDPESECRTIVAYKYDRAVQKLVGEGTLPEFANLMRAQVIDYRVDEGDLQTALDVLEFIYISPFGKSNIHKDWILDEKADVREYPEYYTMRDVARLGFSVDFQETLTVLNKTENASTRRMRDRLYTKLVSTCLAEIGEEQDLAKARYLEYKEQQAN